MFVVFIIINNNNSLNIDIIIVHEKVKSVFKYYLYWLYFILCSKNPISIQGQKNEIFSGISWCDHTVVVLRIVPTIIGSFRIT